MLVEVRDSEDVTRKKYVVKKKWPVVIKLMLSIAFD